ncbi:MAG: VgrG-related protein [Chloroflexi bacterium]|nr:VgrG-related protein [Chloroflexota bacterium]
MVAPTEQTNRTTAVQIKVDGTEFTPEQVKAIEEVAIEQNRHLPAMVTLRLHVDGPEWLSPTAPIAEGKKVEIGAREGATVKPLFVGKIHALELDLHERMPTVIARGYDLSYGLHRVRKRRTFLNVTDSDLATKLASEAGLSPSVESTPVTYEHLFQNNQSDFEFLRERARHVGYDLYVDQQTLHFKKAYPGPQRTVLLEWGNNLKRFRLRTTAAEPVKEVIVRGWDPKAKREIVGRATTTNGKPKIGGAADGSTVAQSTWSTTTEFVVTDEWVTSQGDADKVAQSYLDELGGSFIEAEGLCDGTADIRPGVELDIKQVGERFSGKYFCTATRHVFSTEGGLQLTFVVRARRAGTVSELLDSTRPRARMQGPVVGIVTNLDDPEKMGRVKVRYPWLDDQTESHWLRLVTPLTGAERGGHFLPEVNDEVLVIFEQGEINNAYVIGGLWNGKDKPPVPPALPGGRKAEDVVGGVVKNRLIKSVKGNMLIFNDTPEAPGVFLLGSSGAYVMVDDESGKEKIAIADKTRKNRIEIRSEDNTIHLECEDKFFIKAKGDINVETDANLDAKVTGNAKVNVTGNLEASASGNVTLKGTNITVEATAQLNLKGAMVTLEGTGQTAVKGAIVQVTSSGPAAIKGTPLALN